MFTSIISIAVFCLAVVNAGIIESNHVVQEPVLTKVGTIVHSAPSAVSHQSVTRFHNKAVVAPVLAPVVKTTTVNETPVVSVVKSAPLVHSYAAAPLVHSIHAAPIVHAAHVVHAAPVVHAAVPAAYTIHH